MDVENDGRPTIDELRRMVQEQQDRLQSQAARISALEASLRRADGAAMRAPDDPSGAHGDDGGGVSRSAFLRTAAAGAAGLTAASLVGSAAEPALGELAQPARGARGIVGSWIVSIAYTSSAQRTRGLATFVPGGGFVGSISAYEQAPRGRTPSRGTTLHGTWEATGRRSFGVTAVRLHLDRRGSLLGVITTQIAATLAAGRDMWDGTFTFTAADPAGDVFGRGGGSLRGVRVARSA